MNTVKKVSGFPVPSRDVTYESLVSDFLAGDGNSLTFVTAYFIY